MGFSGKAALALGLLLSGSILLYLSDVWPGVSFKLPKAPVPRVLEVPPEPVDTGERYSPCATDREATRLPITTTVCELVQHPSRFTCRRVRFRATLLTDCFENAVLTARGCEHGIAPSNAPAPASVDAFFHDACPPRRAAFNERRTASFTGRFRIRAGGSGYRYLLDIERVDNPQPITLLPYPEVFLRVHPRQLAEPPLINPEPMALPPYPEILRLPPKSQPPPPPAIDRWAH